MDGYKERGMRDFQVGFWVGVIALALVMWICRAFSW